MRIRNMVKVDSLTAYFDSLMDEPRFRFAREPVVAIAAVDWGGAVQELRGIVVRDGQLVIAETDPTFCGYTATESSDNDNLKACTRASVILRNEKKS